MKEVKEYLENTLNDNSSVVIACSGGPDSMCLLKMVLDIKDNKNLEVICAHVNHKMRKESEEEAVFVKEYCKKHNAIFEYMEITNYDDDNFHNQARIKRYDFFKKLLKKYNADYLLTAHHGDDLIETILMRIVRGSNLKGFIGFKKESEFYDYKILRPLINVSKEEIEKYNHDNNIPYRVDKSNEKDKYTRNRYRHQILPFLKSEDKDVHKKFLKFSRELIKFDDFLANYMSNLLTEIIKDDTLNISLFSKQDEFIQRKIIEYMIDIIQEDDLFYIEDKHIDLILDLLKSNKSNSRIVLPNGFVGEKNYNSFIIKKVDQINDYCIKLEDEVKLVNGYKIFKTKNSQEKSNYVIRLNSEEIKLPLYVRNRKDGDKIRIKNLEGSKKIKDIFIDSKINLRDRNMWPVVVDSSDTIIWLPGLKKSEFDKKNKEKYDIIIRYEEDKDE